MLRELRIKNFAVIDEVGLELKSGLNIITGETGAGKSIILNALGLIAGERGSSDVIRNKEEEATVEALFEGLPPEIESKLSDAGFEADGELVLKRIVNRSGKNRIYVNGGLCPLGLLAAVGGSLVHIYGQHEHHTLLQPDTHLNLLDAFADEPALPRTMRETYDVLAVAWRDLNEARESLEQRRREKNLLEAQAEELTQSRLKAGEEEELRAAKNILAHSEKLYQGCREGDEVLYEGEAALVRQRAAKKLKREMEKEVKGLGMPETTFEARFVTQDEKADAPPFFIAGKKLTERGMDQVEFYFSPNPGEPAKPLAKIASGGELSRLMLALKSLVMTPGVVSTLLFDEVDAGIGGRVAEIVGKKLKQVASRHQVISVTHLPQVAALADAHFVVEKEVEKGRTFTRVRQLSEHDRIDELARMLGGVKITEQARRHAEEMVRGK